MKTITLSVPVRIRDIRVPAGKRFGFLGQAFIEPRLLEELGRNAGAWKEIHAVVEDAPKGKAVARWADKPVTEVRFDESDFQHAEAMAAQGRLFERVHTPECGKPQGTKSHGCDCGGMSPSWRAWCFCPDHRRKEAMVETDRAANVRRKYNGMTPEQIRDTIRREAGQAYQDDAYGQTLEHQFLLAKAKVALAAGLPVQTLVDEAEAEEAAFQAEQDRIRAQRAIEQATLEAKIGPHREAATVIMRRKGLYAADYRVNELALAIADGQDAQVLAQSWRDAEDKANASGGPDTFGFAHGTDFEGGEW